MRIAINISPLSTGHKNRGIGIYTQNLIDNLSRFDKKNQYIFFKEKLDTPVDLVHYPFFDPFFLTLPLIKKFPTVVTVHDLTPIIFQKYYPRGLKGEVKWQIQKFSLKNTSAIITDSQCSKNDIEKLLKINSKKISVVYLAVSDIFKPLEKGSWISETKNKYNLKNDFLLYVGDINYNKNLSSLYKAYSYFFEKKLDLVLVGSVKFQAPANTKTLGFVPQSDLVKLYNLAKVLCLPSFYEGFGLPVLEALSCGCQVVTSGVSSLPEVGGQSVFYADPYSPKDIAEKIKQALQSPKDKKVLLSQSGKFSWQKTVRETVKVYEDTIS